MESLITPSETLTVGGEVHSFSENPLKFEIIKELPQAYICQIENGVRDFMIAAHMSEGVHPQGFFNQTIRSIANATYLNGGGDFWIMTEKGKLLAYVLAHVTNDIDNSLTYWVSQAWVIENMRGSVTIRMAWQKIRERAKQCLCRHMVVVSSRGSDAYCRWLGKGWHEYARLLKEDL